MREKLLVIRSCKECYYLKYNKYTKPKAYCAVMSPDKEIDVDFYQYLPSWCPLEDRYKPVNLTTKQLLNEPEIEKKDKSETPYWMHSRRHG